MIHAQNTRGVILFSQVVTANADTTGYVDCRGFDYATLDVIFSSAASTTNVPTTLKLSEGDTTTAFTDITEFVGGVSTTTAIGWAWPVPTVVPQIFARFQLDLRKRKRYICATMRHTTNTTHATVFANLSRAGIAPDTIAEAGVAALVTV